MENNNDFSISGSGSLASGDYGKVSTSGSGTIRGNITCTAIRSSGSLRSEGDILCTGEIHSSGATTVKGNVTAERLKASGSFNIKGNFTGEAFETSGSSSVDGNFSYGSINSSGSVKVGGGVRANTIDVSGSLTVGKDCEAEEFRSSGRLSIAGLLNAELVTIKVDRGCDVGEIGGQRIEISRSTVGNWLGFLLPLNTGFLKTESIEGDSVYIEYTAAKNVRGKNVYIGPGCTIDYLEYSDSCEISKEATVKDSVKI